MGEITQQPEKYKRGRPTLYQAAFCEKLINYMADGFPFECFGAQLNVTRVTLHEWVHAHPEFAYAKQIGELKCIEWWMKMGRLGVAGKVQNFSNPVWIFTMKNIAKWRDKHDIDVQATLKQEPLNQVLKSKLIDIIVEKEEQHELDSGTGEAPAITPRTTDQTNHEGTPPTGLIQTSSLPGTEGCEQTDTRTDDPSASIIIQEETNSPT